MNILEFKYPEPKLSAFASGHRLSSKDSSPARGSLNNRPSERPRSVTSTGRAHRLRSKQFQVSNPDKIMQGLRNSIVEHPDSLKNNKVICNLQEKLNETVGDLDRHMLKVLHQQETNFLIAYKGVMKQIAQDLNKYKAELKKYTEESKDSENQYLKNTLAVFEVEIMDLFNVTKKFEEQNRELKRKIIDLISDLKSEKELNFTLGKQNHIHQELAKNLYKENRQIIMSTIGNSSEKKPGQEVDASIKGQEGEQTQVSKREDPDSGAGSPVMMSNIGSPVLITENKYDRKNPGFNDKVPHAVRFNNSQGFKDKMRRWNPHEISYRSRSISPQAQSDFEDNGLLRLSLKALLKPNLKAEVDLDDIVESVLANIERCSRNKRHTADTLSSRKGTESVFATLTPRVQEFEQLKSVVSEGSEEAQKKFGSKPDTSYRSRPKSGTKDNGSNKQLMDLSLKEKEINRVIVGTLETARSEKIMFESSENLQGNQNTEAIQNPEEILQRKNTEELLENAIRNFSFADNPGSVGKGNVKKLDLTALAAKIREQESEARRPKSALVKKSGALNRGGSSHRESYREYSQREKKVRESLTLTSLLNIKKEIRLSTEPDYVSSDPNQAITLIGGAYRSKSPETSRIAIYNGKLYVRNVSPTPSNNNIV